MTNPRRISTAWVIVMVLITAHGSMQCFTAWRDSITVDEVPSLSAGLSHWRDKNFDLHKVNPPLVRLVAAAPVYWLGAIPDGWQFPQHPTKRFDHAVGIQLIKEWRGDSFFYHSLARMAVVPFSMLGGLFCFLWGRDLFGQTSGIVSCLLWCFSPMVLAHGHLITSDVTATSFGLGANLFYWRWLKTTTAMRTESSQLRGHSWIEAVVAGIFLGLAELSKTTWVILFPIWILLFLLWRVCHRSKGLTRIVAETSPFVAILLIGIFMINLGYGFEGTGRRLGDYQFASSILRGGVSVDSSGNQTSELGNRFADSVFAKMPVPLPRNYVQGIDMQKKGFEQEIHMYLNGQWKIRGWWYYYLYGMCLKIPTGGILLCLLSVCFLLKGRKNFVDWTSLAVLMLPAIIVIALVSSQTAINRHTRYILPALPCLFVLASAVFSSSVSPTTFVRFLQRAGTICLCWFVLSSVWVYPHSTTYFNEFAGGPFNGPKYLLGSSVDWGQDLLHLKRWLEEHEEADPIHVSSGMWRIDPRIAGIDFLRVPEGPSMEPGRPLLQTDRSVGPIPGWHAIAVRNIYARGDRFSYFHRFQPEDYAGYSIYIYHLDRQQVNDVRADLGLPPIPKDVPPKKIFFPQRDHEG